jgi:hypothetical protein
MPVAGVPLVSGVAVRVMTVRFAPRFDLTCVAPGPLVMTTGPDCASTSISARPVIEYCDTVPRLNSTPAGPLTWRFG